MTHSEPKHAGNKSHYANILIYIILLSIAAYYLKINYSRGAHLDSFISFILTDILITAGKIRPEGILRFMLCTAGGIIYFISQYVLGREISKRFVIRPDEPFLRSLAYAGIGTGVFSLIFFLMGMSGALYRPVIILIASAPAVVYLFSREIWKFVFRTLSNISRHRFTAGEISFLVILTVYQIAGMIGSMSPPSDADALTYHLAVPKLYIEANRIFPLPHIQQSFWPFATEMHYTAAIGAFGYTAPGIINFIYIGLAAAAVGALSRSIVPGSSIHIPMLIFISIPLIHSHYFLSNVEPALAFYLLISISFVIQFNRNHKTRDLVVAAVFSGFAAATKYTGAAYLPILILTIIPASIRRRRMLYDVLIYSSAAVIPIIPWLVRNYFWTGNPVWPFFYSVFGGKYWDELHNLEYMFYLKYFFGETGFIATFKSFFSLATESWNRNIGILLISVIPILITSRKTYTIALIPAFTASSMALVWGMTSPQPRLLFPAIAILCAACSISLERSGRLGRVLVIFAAVFHLILFVAATARHIPYAVGEKMSENTPIDSMNEVYDYVQLHTPRNSKLLLLWDSRGLYSTRPYISGDSISQAYINYTEYSNTSQLMKRLYEERLTHVVVCARSIATAVEMDGMLRDKYEMSPAYPTSIYYLSQHQRNAMSSGWWNKVFISEDGAYILYEIDYSNFKRSDIQR